MSNSQWHNGTLSLCTPDIVPLSLALTALTLSCTVSHCIVLCRTASHCIALSHTVSFCISFTGTGSHTCPSGEQYNGAYVEGRKSGRGEFQYPNKARWVGEMRDDLRNGRGVYSTGTEKYDGEYCDDCMSGEGSYIFPTGSRYFGVYNMNARQGNDSTVWTSPSGDEVSGPWAAVCGSARGEWLLESGEKFWGGTGAAVEEQINHTPSSAMTDALNMACRLLVSLDEATKAEGKEVAEYQQHLQVLTVASRSGIISTFDLLGVTSSLRLQLMQYIRTNSQYVKTLICILEVINKLCVVAICIDVIMTVPALMNTSAELSGVMRDNTSLRHYVVGVNRVQSQLRQYTVHPDWANMEAIFIEAEGRAQSMTWEKLETAMSEVCEVPSTTGGIGEFTVSLEQLIADERVCEIMIGHRRARHLLLRLLDLGRKEITVLINLLEVIEMILTGQVAMDRLKEALEQGKKSLVFSLRADNLRSEADDADQVLMLIQVAVDALKAANGRENKSRTLEELRERIQQGLARNLDKPAMQRTIRDAQATFPKLQGAASDEMQDDIEGLMKILRELQRPKKVVQPIGESKETYEGAYESGVLLSVCCCSRSLDDCLSC